MRSDMPRRFRHLVILVVVSILPAGMFFMSFNETNPLLRSSLYSDVPVLNEDVKKVLIIMTQTRSGSSFTGEIFAATNNSLYLYEPLYPYGIECELPSQREALLRKLLNCDFSGLKDIYLRGFNASKCKDGAHCKNDGFCFTRKSTGLIRRYNIDCNNADHPYSNKCGYPLQPDILASLCEASTLLLTKITRVCTLEEMERVYKYLKALGKQVYVLHLVRDVRSIASSYIKLNGIKTMEIATNAMINIRCPRQRRNVIIKNADRQDYEIMADRRYLRIRYEDLASNAIEEARRVFRFMGRSLPPEVVKNIVNYLHPNKTLTEQIEAKQNVDKQIRKLAQQYKDPFGVVRDPIKILNEWRTLVPFENVREIQNKCGDVLEEMGYVSFASEEKMKDLSVPSFKDRLR